MLPQAISGLMSLANDYDVFIYTKKKIRIERALSLANGCF